MDAGKLTALQTLVIDRLIEALKDPDTATPGMLQAALRFLADNEIQSLPNTKKQKEQEAAAPFRMATG